MTQRSPDALRATVLGELGRALDADGCAWLMDDGEERTSERLIYGRCVVWTADAEPRIGGESPQGAFAVDGHESWLRTEMALARRSKTVRSRFRSVAEEGFDPTHLTRAPALQTMMPTSEIVDLTRMVAYGPEGAFLGWVGAYWRAPIAARRLRSIDHAGLEARVHAAVLEAHQIEVSASSAVPQPNSFVCDVGGDVVAAGDGISDWVAAHRGLLASAIQTTERRDASSFEIRVGTIGVCGQRLSHNESGRGLWACQTRSVEPPALSELASLSPRQYEVAAFAASGATNAEIADALGCAVGTVKTHLSNVYRRLEIDGRVELATRFARNEEH